MDEAETTLEASQQAEFSEGLSMVSLEATTDGAHLGQ